MLDIIERSIYEMEAIPNRESTAFVRSVLVAVAESIHSGTMESLAVHVLPWTREAANDLKSRLGSLSLTDARAYTALAPMLVRSPIIDSTPVSSGPNTDREAYPDLPELPLALRLHQERSITGLYLSGHPLTPYRATIAHFATHNASDIALLRDTEDTASVVRRATLSRDRTPLILGGHCVALTQRKTKSHDRMAKLTWEDFTGTIGVIVSPKVWGIQRATLKVGWTGFLRGTLSDGDGVVEVFANDFIDMATAQRKIAGRNGVKS